MARPIPVSTTNPASIQTQIFFYINKLDGFQPSVPAKIFSTVNAFASSSVNCFAHITRASGFAPGPVL